MWSLFNYYKRMTFSLGLSFIYHVMAKDQFLAGTYSRHHIVLHVKIVAMERIPGTWQEWVLVCVVSGSVTFRILNKLF